MSATGHQAEQLVHMMYDIQRQIKEIYHHLSDDIKITIDIGSVRGSFPIIKQVYPNPSQSNKYEKVEIRCDANDQIAGIRAFLKMSQPQKKKPVFEKKMTNPHDYKYKTTVDASEIPDSWFDIKKPKYPTTNDDPSADEKRKKMIPRDIQVMKKRKAEDNNDLTSIQDSEEENMAITPHESENAKTLSVNKKIKYSKPSSLYVEKKDKKGKISPPSPSSSSSSPSFSEDEEETFMLNRDSSDDEHDISIKKRKNSLKNNKKEDKDLIKKSSNMSRSISSIHNKYKEKDTSIQHAKLRLGSSFQEEDEHSLAEEEQEEDVDMISRQHHPPFSSISVHKYREKGKSVQHAKVHDKKVVSPQEDDKSLSEEQEEEEEEEVEEVDSHVKKSIPNKNMSPTYLPKHSSRPSLSQEENKEDEEDSSVMVRKNVFNFKKMESESESESE